MLDFLNFLRTEYKPGPGEFLPIDMSGLVEKLRLRERGKERGEKGIPHADTESLDELENEIVEAIRTQALAEEKRTNDQMSLYEQRLHAADPRATASEMNATATQSVAQFEAEALAAMMELERAQRGVKEARDALQAFRAENRLERPASLSRNHWLMSGFLAVMFLTETGPNAVLFGAGDELGVLGGFVIAIVFSFLNLAIGFMSGLFSLPNLFHRNLLRRLAGGILGLIAFAVVLALNLLVAHFRAEVGDGATTAVATRDSFDNVLQHPLELHDTLSIGLGVVGVIFSLIATAEGLAWRDRYPGYTAATRHLTVAEHEWTRIVGERLTMLDEVQSRHSDELRLARAALRDRRAAIPEIIAGRTRLARNFGIHLQHLQGVARYALSAYRDANRAARPAGDPAPKHFNEEWHLTGVSVPELTPGPSVGEPEWKAADDALEASMEKLQSAFQDAIAWVGKLNGDHSTPPFASGNLRVVHGRAA